MWPVTDPEERCETHRHSWFQAATLDVNGEVVPSSIRPATGIPHTHSAPSGQCWLDLRLAAGWSVRLGGDCAVSCRREQFGRLSGVVRLVLKWSGNWQAWPGLVRAWAVPRDVGFCLSDQEKWPLGRFSAASSVSSAGLAWHLWEIGSSLVYA
ncbi:hypothetical protein CCHR01_01244 [Colletotrichum chrysophilum]|uniref:Uncharacterized protein n=1 Tax=Colletotrichum chrysophilum TaxID=1836956 RepID=A0AAD9AZR7_9PEZI|nr:hypothetical protein CCHR01_01244 [Colletotrichum chrysophilum]